MTDAIPDEIMREARKSFIWRPSSEQVEKVARALMARDKRAAEIAKQRAKHIYNGAFVGEYAYGASEEAEFIADAILTYSEPSHDK